MEIITHLSVLCIGFGAGLIVAAIKLFNYSNTQQQEFDGPIIKMTQEELDYLPELFYGTIVVSKDETKNVSH